MPRFQTLAAGLAAALLSSACYRVTVVTAPAPATQLAVVDKPWNHSFVYGLVPPAPVDVSRPCGGNISRVVTQRSFLNGLVGALTYSIYTPLQITTTCAGPRTSSADAPAAPVVATAPADSATTAAVVAPAAESARP